MRGILPLLALVATATLHAADLPSVLAEMNRASEAYQGMAAKIRSETYTRLVDDTDVESGDIWVRRDAKGQVSLRIAFAEPTRKQVRVENAVVEMFNEGINQIDEYDLKDKRQQLEEGLLVGYGVSGDNLVERYDVELAGEENVGNEPTVLLDLTPKDEEDRAKGQKLEMWISTATWQPIQQKVTESDGDYRLFTYAGVEINPGVKASDLEFDLSRTKRKPKRVKP